MSELLIGKENMMLEWERFRNRVLPPVERKKGWAQTPVADWGSLPEKEKRHLSELNAFVRRILDSSEECVPEIYDEYPTELKLLVIFRLKRADAFLEDFFRQCSAIRVPEDGDSVQSFFRDIMLQS